ncbi:MAG: type II and III secretion system protein family protein [Alphaproteobacteria bacterium]
MTRLRALLLILCVMLPCAARAEDLVLPVAIDRGETVILPEPATSVFIANPDVADVQLLSPTTVMVYGKKMGDTTLMAVGGHNKTLIKRTVRVGLNVEAVQQALTTLLPDARIKVVGVPDGIMLLGTVQDPAAAEDARRVAARFVPKEGEIVNQLQVLASNQINLRVRVAEVSRALNRFFGVNWNSAFKLSGFAFGLASGAALTNAGALGLNSARPGTSTPENTLNFRHQEAGVDLNGFIDALASDGLITVLAEPNLTAMSGETAFFLAGGEYPILVPQSNGQVSIEYKDFGVKLSFTPTLINRTRINIKVRPEVSELSSEGAVTLNNFKVPALKVRRAETTVELASGQSFAIAGMLSNNSDQNVDKFPLLGDMPVLGDLFRSTRFRRGETELVIIVTPYMVRPSNEQLALPTDGLAPPSETERVLEQRAVSADKTKKPISGMATAVALPPAAASAAPTASGGFIVE